MNSRFPKGARDLVVGRVHADLRRGRWAPGATLDVTALAAELGMSPSPVREGLALLIGERVLESSHRSGFSVPRLMPYELADEYRVLGMIADGLAGLIEKGVVPSEEVSRAPRIDRLVWSFALRANVPTAVPLIAAGTLRIANYLRAEPFVIADCEEEAAQLARLASTGTQTALRRCLRQAFRRRIVAAAGICRAAEKTSKSFEKVFE